MHIMSNHALILMPNFKVTPKTTLLVADGPSTFTRYIWPFGICQDPSSWRDVVGCPNIEGIGTALITCLVVNVVLNILPLGSQLCR